MAKLTLGDILNSAGTGYVDTLDIRISINTLADIAGNNTKDKGGEYNGQDTT